MHTHQHGYTHTHSYPNSDFWAERHYGFGCQLRASYMNCSDQRNASLITPICAWSYIYIMFQHSLSEGLKNLGQNRGKCKKGQAVSSRSWVLNEELTKFMVGLTAAFVKKSVYQANKSFTCVQSEGVV